VVWGLQRPHKPALGVACMWGGGEGSGADRGMIKSFHLRNFNRKIGGHLECSTMIRLRTSPKFDSKQRKTKHINWDVTDSDA
jgi:hypothetical protein